MKIVADENIVAVADLYRRHGELVLLPGRSIALEHVQDADVLLVRSITRVDRALLEGSRVRFVATATSGTDHLDLPWLAQQGIAVAEAAGSNANAVVEYCLASLAELVLRGDIRLAGRSVAIIGFGQVGSRLHAAFQKIGIEALVCDPFVEAESLRAGRQSRVQFCSLDEALQASVISLHTPLTRSTAQATWHLLDSARIEALPAGTVLINAARGAVVCNQSLLARLQRSNDLHCILDVWENEPQISTALLHHVALGTPHIAGYSVEAKASASERNYRDFLQHFALADERAAVGAADMQTTLQVDLRGALTDEQALARCLQAALPVAQIDQELRACESDAALFDAIRKRLSARREFAHYALEVVGLEEGRSSAALASQVTALGFQWR
jgi:erythronate-4-phosphate dehydrogenase